MERRTLLPSHLWGGVGGGARDDGALLNKKGFQVRCLKAFVWKLIPVFCLGLMLQ